MVHTRAPRSPEIQIRNFRTPHSRLAVRNSLLTRSQIFSLIVQLPPLTTTAVPPGCSLALASSHPRTGGSTGQPWFAYPPTAPRFPPHAGSGPVSQTGCPLGPGLPSTGRTGSLTRPPWLWLPPVHPPPLYALSGGEISLGWKKRKKNVVVPLLLEEGTFKFGFSLDT
jgi:hypothetical protein